MLTRIKSNIVEQTLGFVDIWNGSILLKEEVISQSREYAHEKILVHVTSRDLFLVHHWQVVHKFVEPNYGNTLKMWLAPLPGFCEETFPFLICSGWESFNIINVKDFRMEVLINASGKKTNAQMPAFFVEEKEVPEEE